MAIVNWTRTEMGEVLDAVFSSLTVCGRKNALGTLNQAWEKIEANDKPIGCVTIRPGKSRAAFAAEALHARSASAARSALRWREEAALQVACGTHRPSRKQINLSNVRADASDQCVCHVSSQSRSAR